MVWARMGNFVKMAVFCKSAIIAFISFFSSKVKDTYRFKNARSKRKNVKVVSLWNTAINLVVSKLPAPPGLARSLRACFRTDWPSEIPLDRFADLAFLARPWPCTPRTKAPPAPTRPHDAWRSRADLVWTRPHTLPLPRGYHPRSTRALCCTRERSHPGQPRESAVMNIRKDIQTISPLISPATHLLTQLASAVSLKSTRLLFILVVHTYLEIA